MAAPSGSIRAGSAYVEIFGEDGKLDRVLAGAKAKLRAFDKAVSGVGTAGIAIASGAIAPIAVATKTFASYEQALANLRAAASPTAAQMDQITKAIDRVSKSTGVGPTEVAGAFGELLKAGMPLEKVLGGAAESAVQFAKVGELKVADAAVTMSDALNVFGKNGMGAAESVDILSRAADAASTNVQQIAMAFSMSSAEFKSNDQSLRDLATSIAVVANAGIKGSDAGTSLKTMLSRLATGSETAGAAMDKLGLNFRKADGTMKPMRAIIVELESKLGKLDAATRKKSMADLFGTDGIRAAEALLSMGAKGWDEFTASMAESKTVAQKYATMTDTLNGGWGASAAAVERLSVAIGAALSPTVSNAIAEFSAVVEKVTQWVAANDPLTRSLGEGAIKAALWAAGVGGGLLVLGKVAGLAVGAVSALRTVNIAMATLAANPVVLILGGIVAVAYAIARSESSLANFNDTAAQAVETGNRQRALDLDRFDRLKQLSSATKLNSDEQKEASSIVAELEGRYGKLGISIDATTGKVAGLTAAQEKLNRQMRADAIAAAKAAEFEAQDNYNSAKHAYDAENKSDFANIGTLWSAVTEGKSGALTKRSEMLRRSAALNEATRRRKAIEGSAPGDRGAVTGGIAGAPAGAPRAALGDAGDWQGRKRAAAIETIKQAEKDLGDISEQQAAKRRTALEAEVHDIKRVAAERVRLLAVMAEAERAKGNASEARYLVEDARRVAERARQDVAAANRKAAVAMFNDVVAGAKAKLAEMAQVRNDIDAQLRSQESQQAVADAQAAADRARGTPQEDAANKALLAAQRAAQAEQARQWKVQQLADARERLKGDPAALADAEKRISALAERMAFVPDTLAQAERQMSATGTFSAAGAGLLGNGGSALERAAKATEAMAKLGPEILRALETVGFKFG
jgi:TP901 family phage tail tape measure protein